MKFTEEYIQNLAAPLSATAEARCKEALENVSAALKGVGYSHTTEGGIRRLVENTQSFSMEMRRGYNGRTIKIFTQGSYANDTNISKTSDVDVAVVLESTFIMKDPEIYLRLNESHDQIRSRYNFSASDDTAMHLKDDVEDALRRYFEINAVQRKNKSIKVKGNTVRTDCDTVPAIRNRDYSKDTTINENNYIGGIQIHADDGGIIVNYPEQHIRNGVTKNSQTNYNFKKCVRAAKNIRELMKSNGYSIPDEVSSFGIESLIWNASNEAYNKYASLRYIFDEVLIDLENRKNYWVIFKEANGIKNLFSDSNMKNKYSSFFNDLREFYEYA